MTDVIIEIFIPLNDCELWSINSTSNITRIWNYINWWQFYDLFVLDVTEMWQKYSRLSVTAMIDIRFKGFRDEIQYSGLAKKPRNVIFCLFMFTIQCDCSLLTMRTSQRAQAIVMLKDCALKFHGSYWGGLVYRAGTALRDSDSLIKRRLYLEQLPGGRERRHFEL